jgi:uncharacterized protein (TIGR02996 family)
VIDLEASLLASVLASPEQDGPRLVYADWLTERGDPRGQFIREQVQLAGLEETDPRWSALHASSERLAHRHRQEWLALLGLDRLQVRQLTFSRGLLEGAWLDQPSPRALQDLLGRAPLRWLRLDPQQLTPELLEVAAGAGLGLSIEGELGRYSVGRGSIEHLPPESLQRLDLTLWLYYLIDAVMRRLLSGPSLRELCLRTLWPGDQLDGILHPLVEAGLMDELTVLELRVQRQPALALQALFARRSERPVRLALGGSQVFDPLVPGLLGWRPLEALELPALSERAASELLSSEALWGALRRLHLPCTLRGRPIHRLCEGSWPRLSRLASDAATGGLLQKLSRTPVAGQLVELRAPEAERAELLAWLHAPYAARLVSLSAGVDNQALAELARWPGLSRVTELSLAQEEPVSRKALRVLLQSPHLDPVSLVARGAGFVPHLPALRERFPGALAQG